MTRRRTRTQSPVRTEAAGTPQTPVRSAGPSRGAAQPPPRNADPSSTGADHLDDATASSAWHTFLRRRGTQLAVVAASLAFFVVNAVVVARTDTPTPDEFVYVPAGYYHLQTGDLSFDPTNPPLLKLLMALPLASMDLAIDLDPRRRDNSTGWGPWIFGTSFMDRNRDRYLDAFFRARLVIVAIAAALGLLLYLRARELLTAPAALAVLVLYATTSTLIAHGALATLDMGVTALLFAAFFATSRFAVSREWGWAVMTGVLFGFAFAVKGTAALLAPLVPVMVALEWRQWNQGGAARFAAGGAVMALAAWAAIMTSYGWSGFPLPAPLLEGIRFQIAASGAGEFPAFLWGSWSQTGWWYYYLAALLLKTPVATLVLLVAGAFAVARERMRAAGDWWIVLPPLLLIYVLSFHYAKDYGIRYLLPALPFLLLLAGRGVDLLLKAGRRAQIVVGLLLLWQTGACIVAAPNHLAYFNELAGGPDHARRLLLDSNLDWGQDLGRLKKFLDERGTKNICLGYFGHVDPHVYGIDYTLAPSSPTPGLCAISANFLGGYPYAITYAGERIRGVRAGAWSWFDRLEPVARVGRSIYVFDVKAEDARRLGAASPVPAGKQP